MEEQEEDIETILANFKKEVNTKFFFRSIGFVVVVEIGEGDVDTHYATLYLVIHDSKRRRSRLSRKSGVDHPGKDNSHRRTWIPGDAVLKSGGVI